MRSSSFQVCTEYVSLKKFLEIVHNDLSSIDYEHFIEQGYANSMINNNNNNSNRTENCILGTNFNCSVH